MRIYVGFVVVFVFILSQKTHCGYVMFVCALAQHQNLINEASTIKLHFLYKLREFIIMFCSHFLLVFWYMVHCSEILLVYTLESVARWRTAVQYFMFQQLVLYIFLIKYCMLTFWQSSVKRSVLNYFYMYPHFRMKY